MAEKKTSLTVINKNGLINKYIKQLKVECKTSRNKQSKH